MSLRLCRRLLWAVFVVTVPVPLVIPLWARVPAARILMLALVTFVSMIVETTRGAVVPLAILLLVQSAVAMAALWLLAYGLARLTTRMSPTVRAVLTAAIAVTLLAVTTTESLYRDPYRPETIHSNLVQVYE